MCTASTELETAEPKAIEHKSAEVLGFYTLLERFCSSDSAQMIMLILLTYKIAALVGRAWVLVSSVAESTRFIHVQLYFPQLQLGPRKMVIQRKIDAPATPFCTV